MRVPTLSLARVAVAMLAVAIVGAGLAGCAADGDQANRATRSTTVLHPALATYPRIRVEENIQYSDPDGHPLRLDVCLPKASAGATIAPRPAIAIVHGGSWAFGSKANPAWRSVCLWLASSGYVAASVDYRFAPENPYPDAITDVQNAIAWLRAPAQVAKFSIDPKLIGVLGGSAGGNLASMIGTSGTGSLDSGTRVAAVAELSGPSNLTKSGAVRAILRPYVLRYLGCRSFENCPTALAASPLFNVAAGDPPFFIANSTDELVPLSQSSKFVAKLRSVGDSVTFVIVKGRHHSISMLDASLKARIAAFFHAKLVH